MKYNVIHSPPHIAKAKTMKEMNRIYLQDCISFMKELEGESIDLIIADPPPTTSKRILVIVAMFGIVFSSGSNGANSGLTRAFASSNRRGTSSFMAYIATCAIFSATFTKGICDTEGKLFGIMRMGFQRTRH